MTSLAFCRITEAASCRARGIALLAGLAALLSATYAHAAPNNNENASDILGQFSSLTSDVTHVYTKGCANNGASSIGFDNPANGTIDATNHWLFISDSGNNRVLVFPLTSGNVLSSKTPTYVLGQPNFSSCGQGTTQSTMWSPAGLAVDSANHRLFVADSGNARVLVFSTSSMSNGMNAANVLGQANFTSRTFTVSQSSMEGPIGLALDSVNNRLFVSDYEGSRVLVFNTSSITNGMNASNVLGEPDFVTNSGGGMTQSGMDQPAGLAYDSTNTRLFVSDTYDNRVLVFNTSSITDGMNASYVLGEPDFVTNSGGVTTQSGMYLPGGLAFDSVDNLLYMADSYNDRVLVFSTSSITNGMNASNVLGEPDFVTDNGGATQSELSTANSANGLAYDATNNLLYVADTYNSRMMVFNTSSITNGMNAADLLGQYNSLTSTATVVWTNDAPNNGPSALGFDNPEQIAMDTVNHRLFVSDTYNNRVLVFALNIDNSFPAGSGGHTASYVLGQANFTNYTPALSQSGMYGPAGLAFDPVNNLLYVADRANDRVLVFSTSSITNGMNASNVLGEPDFVTDNGGATQSTMSYPVGLALDSVNNRLFVADEDNNRVLVFNTSVITNGMNASNVLGEPDFVTVSFVATQSGMFSPDGVAFDSVNNRLFVAEYVNSRVLVFNTSSITNGMNASNVLGEPNFTQRSSARTQAGMSYATGVAFDATFKRLFVSDYGGSRVLVFNTSVITNGMNASNVLGEANFTSSFSGNPTQKSVSNAQNVFYDPGSSRLFVSDSSNRVMIFDCSVFGWPPGYD